MFGLEFLFSWGLLALPLAGLPVLLHLLFRRKSPIVHFSTLRFIKSSVQHTAARKRVQRWLLLAVRMLLLALLIWAIAQPAKKLASGFLGTGSNGVAAIVVDTSFSMELQQEDVTLLNRADDIVQNLLRDQLRDAKVALLTSGPENPNEPPQLREVSEILGQWQPLAAEASPAPLAEQINRAVDLLSRQGAEQKWLIVLTDLQAREFARPLPSLEGVRVVFLDLHPRDPHNVGITRIAIQPAQPIPGVASQVAVQVAGTPNEARAVTIALQKLDGTALATAGPLMANLDAGGRAEVRFPVNFPAERWTLVRASLGSDDSMGWDNVRTQLIEIPARQLVTVIQPTEPRQAARMTRLALDPSEGKVAAWPLDVRANLGMAGDENVVVFPMFAWPDESTTSKLHELVRKGGTLITLLQPGIESSWDSLPESSRKLWTEILPSAPVTLNITGNYHAIATSGTSELIKGLTDEQFQLNTIVARRLVGFSANESGVTAILNAAPVNPGAGVRSHGLIYRKKLALGTAYTIATMPEPRFSNLGTHPIFLPLLVRMSLQPIEQGGAQNAEIGQRLLLSGQRFAGYEELEIENPSREVTRVKSETVANSRNLSYDAAGVPGLYIWRKLDDANPLAISNVQLPAGEAELDYREVRTVVPDTSNILVANSLEDLKDKISSLAEPEPRWSWAIALVLVLICLEALMGSISKLWKLPSFLASSTKPA